MLKRLFSLLIIAVLCLNALPLSAWYAPIRTYDFEPVGDVIEPTEPIIIDDRKPISEYGEITPPLKIEEDFEQFPIFDTIDDAVAYLVESNEKRVDTIGIRLAVNEVYDEKTSNNKLLEVFYQIRDKAAVHTGLPYGGDYLYRQSSLSEGHVDWAGHWETTLENIFIITEYAFTYKYLYYSDAEQEAQVGPAIENLITELNLRSPHKSDLEKIRAVYDWIVHNIDYDFEHYNQGVGEAYITQYSAYGGIIERCCVCQGFASLFYRIMLTLGIDCRHVGGKSTPESTGGHAWNIVQADGLYYLVDTTWDSVRRMNENNAGQPSQGNIWFMLGTNSRYSERVYDDYCGAIMAAYPVSQCSYEAHDAARTSGKLAPTCTEAGATGSGVCPDCGVTLENFAIPSLGHDYDESGNCSRCGKVKPSYPLGDLNFDSDVNVRDGVVMQRVLSGLEADAELLESADLNLDGDVTVIDGVIMQRILAGLQAE